MKRIYVIGMLLIICSSYSSGMNGELKKEKRDVGAFESIGLGISADLYLKQGSISEVIIEAEEDFLEKIITEVKNGKLIIRLDDKKISKYPRAKIYITNPVISGLSVSGSGDIIAESVVKTDEIDLRISGSGDINIDDLVADKATVGISGSGNIALGGSQNLGNLDLSISGSGTLEAEKLETENFKAKISGSGSCHINVQSTLYASISGSGKIYYIGNPQIDANISGSGKIVSVK